VNALRYVIGREIEVRQRRLVLTRRSRQGADNEWMSIPCRDNWTQVLAWVDGSAPLAHRGVGYRAPGHDGVSWLRVVPFIVLHAVVVVGIWFVPLGALEAAVGLALYGLRMFAITAFYHRYFAHKSFSTSRTQQFFWAAVAAASAQRGPLWWAANHRQHHRSADTEDDPHDARRGFWWSDVGWFLCDRHYVTKLDLVRDWSRYPELRWLDRFDLAMPILMGSLTFVAGELLAGQGFATSGWQLLFWGYLVSTVVLLHATLCINSLAHRLGKRRYDTGDSSRNSLLLALLTLGEGWHNNHHRYCGSVRQGFARNEPDITYWLLRGMARLHLVWGLREVPQAVLGEHR